MIASKKSVELLENGQIGILRELADLKANHEKRFQTIERKYRKRIAKLADKMTDLSSRLAAVELKIKILEDAAIDDGRRLKQPESGVN